MSVQGLFQIHPQNSIDRDQNNTMNPKLIDGFTGTTFNFGTKILFCGQIHPVKPSGNRFYLFFISWVFVNSLC